MLSILDTDNLYVRESQAMPENMTGRSILTSDAGVLYSVSDSGLMILPVGRLKQYHRVAPSTTDLVVRGNFCNRAVITQNLTITDPGGGITDFSLSSGVRGVSFSPASGITPATVQVRVDPTAFQNQNGTVTVPVTVASTTAVNIPRTLRLLINSRNPDQRGTFANLSGVLTDVVADPIRNRFYVVQQDLN